MPRVQRRSQQCRLQAKLGDGEGCSSFCRANQRFDQRKAIIGLTNGRQFARLQQELSAADLQTKGLVGPKVADWKQTQDTGCSMC